MLSTPYLQTASSLLFSAPPPMPPGVAAYHLTGPPAPLLADFHLFLLPADAARGGGVPCRTILPDRQHPCWQIFIFFFFPPMPPRVVAFHAVPSYRTASTPAGRFFFLFSASPPMPAGVPAYHTSEL